jgi:hypothetical protein
MSAFISKVKGFSPVPSFFGALIFSLAFHPVVRLKSTPSIAFRTGSGPSFASHSSTPLPWDSSHSRKPMMAPQPRSSRDSIHRAAFTWPLRSMSASNAIMTRRPFHSIRPRSGMTPFSGTRAPLESVATPIVPFQFQTPEILIVRNRAGAALSLVARLQLPNAEPLARSHSPHFGRPLSSKLSSRLRRGVTREVPAARASLVRSAWREHRTAVSVRNRCTSRTTRTRLDRSQELSVCPSGGDGR